MQQKNELGIWMDHATAHLIDTKTKKNSHFILSKFTTEAKEEALSRSENIMHNKEQQMHESYYKKIGAEILKYKHVLVFGPTNAKVELRNYLNEDSHFKDIKIDLKPADNMTDNEQDAFVRNHFEMVE
jgi:stalled ribosome rescue protein Dom34